MASAEKAASHKWVVENGSQTFRLSFPRIRVFVITFYP